MQALVLLATCLSAECLLCVYVIEFQRLDARQHGNKIYVRMYKVSLQVMFSVNLTFYVFRTCGIVQTTRPSLNPIVLF